MRSSYIFCSSVDVDLNRCVAVAGALVPPSRLLVIVVADFDPAIGSALIETSGVVSDDIDTESETPCRHDVLALATHVLVPVPVLLNGASFKWFWFWSGTSTMPTGPAAALVVECLRSRNIFEIIEFFLPDSAGLSLLKDMPCAPLLDDDGFSGRRK
jgi:hypothetical protein